MAETMKNPQSPDESSEIVLSKVDALEQKIECMIRTKRNTAMVTYGGLTIIIIFVALFIFNFVTFVKNYDTVELTAALSSNAIEIAQSEKMQEFLLVFRDKFIPALKVALVEKVQEDAPLFKRSTQELVEDLENYLKYQIIPKLAHNLTKELTSSEAQVLTTYSKSKPSLEKISQIILNSHQFLLGEITKSLDFKLDKALNTLAGLDNSFQEMYSHMEDTPVLKGFTPDMIGDVENFLIETMLKIIIYQLNPQKGNMPAFANGGAK
jgi:hypothetical protein